MQSDFGYSEEKDIGKPYDIKLLKRLWPYTRPYWVTLICAVFLIIIITVLDISMPYIIKIAIDKYIVPQDLAQVLDIEQKIQGVSLAAAVFLIVIIFNFLLNFVQVMIMEYAGQGIMHDLRIKLFAHIQSLPVPFFNKTPIARLVTRNTNDIQNMHELFTSVIVFVFKDMFLLIGIALVLLSIRWQLALACFTLLPFVIYSSFYFARKARDAFRTLRIKTSEINNRFSETISGIKVIQIFRQEAQNYKKLKKINHEFYIAGMEQIRIFAMFMPLVELFNSTALALVIYFGGGSVVSDKISLGVLVAFISYMRMFFNPIRDIAEKYNILQNAMSSAERIFILIDEPVRKKHEHVIKSGRIEKIEFDNVYFEYVKDEPVLKGISFEIKAGETIAIAGPTGSGKTSLINLITRFYDIDSGEIRINGHDIQKWDIGDLRSRIALVTQDPFLFSDSVKNNIIQQKDGISHTDFLEILKASNCDEFIHQLSQGADTILSEGGGSISSGERQLISIARAFARNPELIILDEATSYIDSETEVRIQDAVSNLMQNRTSIVVAHRLSTARNADSIIVINKGRIIESGTHEKLMENKGFYYKLNQLQK
ncbi:putative ABC transporter, permease protein [Desulfonema limicola]|uniref:Multidrug resistance-like ATP-binding protein MdlA n=1 Tax=Desulfonema limicola TaxID=45656 RepID=A0A975B9Y8_9BACT|nr:ABC transporter ATP-binding protein [Desulfonema limicola]QTA81518.1 putative ABC transporter, permease protein [Desulfonema limicola]